MNVTYSEISVYWLHPRNDKEIPAAILHMTPKQDNGQRRRKIIS